MVRSAVETRQRNFLLGVSYGVKISLFRRATKMRNEKRGKKVDEMIHLIIVIPYHHVMVCFALFGLLIVSTAVHREACAL
jgi:hypothetical protein